MNIKERREQLGISQKELAEKVGMSQSFLCDIEQGRSKPSIDTALKIAEALNIDDIKFFVLFMYKHFTRHWHECCRRVQKQKLK